ncbi:MAG: carboxy terminal-processing peptidase [Verrucomicrobiota bacterium]
MQIIMRHLKLKNIGFIALAAVFCFLIAAGCVTTRKTPPPPPPTAQAPARLKPGPNDGQIAYWTARYLEDYHYSQQLLDTEMSRKFFDDYLETLDPRRENFLQSDLAEFAYYRTNLDALTLGRHETANLTPAFVIFQRFVERFEQHVACVDELLQQDKFKFNTDEHILLDRSHAPYPKDLNEARQLWRQHLRYEYLLEKISREISPTNDSVNMNLPKSATDEITDSLAKHYRRNLQMVTNWDSDNILQAYLNALAHAYDPHSDYMNNEHAQDFSINMSLSLFGIGAKLSEDDGYCTIDSLVRGGPADKGKQLKEKDRIIAVAQSNQPPVNVVDMELPKVVQLIRGPKGTEVRLTISPADDRAARRVLTLVRDEIKLEDQEAKARLIELPDRHGGTNRIGVIDLPSFYAPVDSPNNAGHSKQSYVSVDVAKLIKKLEQEKIVGLILDMRSNPGGSLDEAIRLTGLFIKEGPVVQARNSNGHISVDSDNDPGVLYDGPLVVLVNRFSASASEIAAAALQDYGRALIVGDTSTFGKGTVQNLNPLRPIIWPANASATNDPGMLKITIRKFYRVTGASTQLRGVTPDLILPDTLSYRTDVTSERTLENALPWDPIQPVNYNKLNLVQPSLTLLRERSDARVATNQDFIYIRQDIAELQKLQGDKPLIGMQNRPWGVDGPVTLEADDVATLNEREALKEREKIAAENRARDAERAARKAPDEKIYELTVENCDQPGLPACETNVVDYAKIGEVQLDEAARLDETENILEDYVSLLSKSNILIANHPDL